MDISLVPWPSNARTSPAPQLQKRGNEKRAGRVWQITMPGSVLTVGMLPVVLMKERTSVQPTSVRVRIMTGNKYTVKHRNFENWSCKGPIVLKIWKRKFAELRNRGIPAGRPGRTIPKLSPIMLFQYSWKYLVLFSELSPIITNYSWRTCSIGMQK